MFDGFRVYYVAWWDLLIVAVFVLGCDFGFASDALIAPTRQNFALICSILVGLVVIQWVL